MLALSAGACGTAPSGTPGAAPAAPTSPAPPSVTPSGSGTTAPNATTTTTTTLPPTTPPTTAPPTPPTTALPVAPQPSAAQAAAALVAGWSAGNRPFALSVAVPSAVDTLFAVPYPGANAVFRGCSEAFPPLVCTYGPPALGSGTLFEIYVSQVPNGGWYVSSVVVET